MSLGSRDRMEKRGMEISSHNIMGNGQIPPANIFAGGRHYNAFLKCQLMPHRRTLFEMSIGFHIGAGWYSNLFII